MLGAIVHLGRGAHVGFVLAREGALALVDPTELPPHLRLVLRIGRMLERPGLVGPQVVDFARHVIAGNAEARPAGGEVRSARCHEQD